MNRNTRIKELLKRFAAGEHTIQEAEELFSLFNSDADLTSDFPEVEEILGAIGVDRSMDPQTSQRIYQQIESATSSSKSSKLIKLWKPLKYVAAASIVVGLVLLSHNFLTNVDLPREPKIGVFLEMDNGVEKLLQKEISLEILDAKGKVIGEQQGDRLVYYKSDQVSEDSIRYNKITVPLGQRYSVELVDGTKVDLNAGSSLRFPVNLGNERITTLTGEAYFDVTRDLDRPFIVRTNGVDIKVHGTRFNVANYKEDGEINVVLEEGSVEMLTTDHATYLVPGTMGRVVLGSSKINVTEVAPNLYTSWKSGELVFREMSFQNILHKLERHYDVRIINENTEVSSKIFNANFGKLPLEEVLENLEIYYGLESYRNEQGEIIIY